MGGAPPSCDSDAECQDGIFCNGTEQCIEGRCESGTPPKCDDGIPCTIDVCSHLENGCSFSAPDRDGDGHADANCLGPNDEPLGDDCDDEDANRYPGNVEVCALDDPTHDEDCDPETYGRRDADADGEVSAECCNENDEGELTCGPDCDDGNPSRFPTHPEICDDIDNDCDGEIDTNTREVDWFPDEDGDQYGAIGGESVSSCAPVPGHSLRATDCDDSLASVHPAASEVCNGIDDDCDGEIDEEGVCLCFPERDSRACACAPQVSGSQTCVEGTWSACDCTECVSGVSDCLGDLLPRSCLEGRWIVGSACQGLRPICLAGQCVCADGSENCEEIEDIVPPVIVDSYPANAQLNVSPAATMAIVFSEPMASASFSADSVALRDSRGTLVPGLLALGGTTLSFTPSAPLAPGMDYTLSVDVAVADLSGNVIGPRDPIQFTTDLDLVARPVGSAPYGYRGVELAMSRLGRREMLAFQSAATGDILLANQVRFVWDGQDWIEASAPFHGSTVYSLALDDTGISFALSYEGSELSRAQTTDGTWDSPVAYSVSDNNTPAVLQANSAGQAALLYFDGTALSVVHRDSGGAWEVQGASTVSDGSGLLKMSLNEDGALCVVYRVPADSSFGVMISEADFGGFTNHQHVPLSYESVVAADVAIAEDGEATVVWVELDAGLGEGAAARFRAIDVAISGWIGSSVPLSSQQGIGLPRVGIDEAGARVVAYLVDGAGLYATRRPAGETAWSTPRRINALDSGAVSYDLNVADSGEALLVWTQEDTHVDLFFSKYSPASGWSLPRRLEVSATSVESFSAGIDAEGNAVVVFASDGQLNFVEL